MQDRKIEGRTFFMGRVGMIETDVVVEGIQLVCQIPARPCGNWGPPPGVVSVEVAQDYGGGGEGQEGG